MLHILKNRRDQARGTEDGFTLIELMVVVLIIAILLAIAIPTFLGAQNKAKDRSAQSSVRNALTAAKTLYTDVADYSSTDISATENPLQAVEPSLTFQTAVSADAKQVSIAATSPDTFYAAALSKTGTCFYVKDVVASGGGTVFKKDESSAAKANCSGSYAKGSEAAVLALDDW